MLRRGTVTELLVVVEQVDEFEDAGPAEFEEDGGDAPDEQVQIGVSLEVGEERPAEDVEESVVCLAWGY